MKYKKTVFTTNKTKIRRFSFLVSNKRTVHNFTRIERAKIIWIPAIIISLLRNVQHLGILGILGSPYFPRMPPTYFFQCFNTNIFFYNYSSQYILVCVLNFIMNTYFNTYKIYAIIAYDNKI